LLLWTPTVRRGPRFAVEVARRFDIAACRCPRSPKTASTHDSPIAPVAALRNRPRRWLICRGGHVLVRVLMLLASNVPASTISSVSPFG